MADIEFSHDMGAYGRTGADPERDATPGAVSTATHIAGAVVSLALIAGVCVWGYKLMVRDVSGIPVVRAAEGDMRVRPEDPGGELARHQGLAVNTIAAQGFASGPVDQVRLAPRPAALAEEDQPVAVVAPVVAPEPLSPASDAFAEADAADAVAEALALSDQATGTLSAEPLPEALETSEPVSASAAAATVATDTGAAVLLAAAEALPVAEPAVLDAPGLKVSMRPRLRPADVVQKASFSPATASAEIDPARIPSGTRLAQLGAFDSADVARSEWDRLSVRFGDFLEGKSRVVQEAQSGGRTFWRLRAMGFKDLNDSRRFCAAFKAEGVDCIPVASK